MISQIEFFKLLLQNRPITTIENGFLWYSSLLNDGDNIIAIHKESHTSLDFLRLSFKAGHQVDFSKFVYDNFIKIFES